MSRTAFVIVQNGVAIPDEMPHGMRVEIIDLDAILANPVIEFERLSRQARRLVADEHSYAIEINSDGARSRCENCERSWCDALLAPSGTERVIIQPSSYSGARPVCGAFCHPIN